MKREHLDSLETEAQNDGAGQTLRQQKARQRAARERQERVDQAIEAVQHLAEQRLTDGGFSTVEDIEATTKGGTTVYTPVKEEAKQKEAGKDPFAPKPKDSPIIAEWRQRMGTDAAKELYKRRAPAAELPNARGLAKVKAALWWHVLAINLLRAEVLLAAKQKSAGIPCTPVA